jgi:hypothetical protein
MTFDEMEKGDLREYLDFLMRQYRVVDAFWYIYLEEAYGTETANHFNEKVWGRVAGLAAEIVRSSYKRRVSRICEALDTSWTMQSAYRTNAKLVQSIPPDTWRNTRHAKEMQVLELPSIDPSL